MNILDHLRVDHAKLRKELVNIRQSPCSPAIRSQIKHFILSYELYESMEEEVLFPALDKFLKDLMQDEILKCFYDKHDNVWVLLDQLVDAMRGVAAPLYSWRTGRLRQWISTPAAIAQNTAMPRKGGKR